MSEINLSSAVRTSLSSLQATASFLSSTQERLATGNRVNSALDDPTAFFTASALNNRASDLSTLLDAQQQAIRTVEVADQGITAIEDLADSARAQATAALQTDDPAARAAAAASFDDILTQIEGLAEDSSFNGTNLLEGDSLQVVFNESGSSNLTVDGVDFSDAETLGLNRISNVNNPAGVGGGSTISATPSTIDVNQLFAGPGVFATAIGNFDNVTITFETDTGPDSITFNGTANDGAGNFASSTDPVEVAAAIQSVLDSNNVDPDDLSLLGTTLVSGSGDIDIFRRNSDFVSTSITSAGDANGTAFVPSIRIEGNGGGSNFAADIDINEALAAIDDALGTLRSTAASLGSDLSTIQIRQDFTSSLINTLQAGAGDLTLADLNEEGANLLTLQTRQQLASTSLSFATQSDQSVLSLF